MDWRNQVVCLTVDPELFSPVSNTRPALAQIEEAKAACAICVVLDACLKWVLDNNQDSEVWGGTSEDERHALRWRSAR